MLSPLHFHEEWEPRGSWLLAGQGSVTGSSDTWRSRGSSLPRMFPGRNTRRLMANDPSQYSPRLRYLFLGSDRGVAVGH